MNDEPIKHPDDALLMLYVADELTGSERDAVEVRVAQDPALAQQLEQLRVAYVRSFAALAELDAAQRLPASEGVVVRRVSRAISQWQVNRIVKEMPPMRRGLAMPWWSYPSAAVAVMIIGFLVWSMHQVIGPMPADPSVQQNLQLADLQSDSLTDWLESGFSPRTDLSDDSDGTHSAPLDDVGATLPSPREDSTW